MITGKEVKKILREKGIRNYELAECLKIAESTMCRRLRDGAKFVGQAEKDVLEAVDIVEMNKKARA